ncbi:SipW-dependent-type signal peptide-containing protein [Eubacterium sp. 1001713B170207_170306_E7]|uniref:SipW-dependent-type signal peptide-containing protein n=1 Tax=Eubacterium sp. 1001713B170207_170306_E7 TaxID=2787097 RepID=UPI00189BED0B|nr:SipW-dependent-type signal peptide-containing protein [Eubacterium sp. 1001713B170207_170306_E7]
MTKAKKRNVIVALALVALLAIGGTLAYLTAVTDTASNTFTMGKGITGDTEEPNWKPEEAEKFTPGKVIAKDPQIVNTSEESADPVYAAATLTYQVKNDKGEWTESSYADLNKFINIKHGNPLTDGFNTDADTGWTMDKDNTIAYYNATLAAKARTSSIFDAVEIDKLALTPDQINDPTQFDQTKYTETDADGNVISYTEYKMQDFQIVIKGYLVQAEGFGSAQDAMQTAFPTVFK